MSDGEKLTLERPTTPVSARICESNYEVPMSLGESVHIGYNPITEEEAFSKTHLKEFVQLTSGFDWARGEMSCERAIALIRKFVWANNSYFSIPKPTQFVLREAIYETMVSYTDTAGRHVCMRVDLHVAKYVNKVAADKLANERIVLETNYLFGEYRAFNQFYKYLRFYIESDGTIDPQIYSREKRPKCRPFPAMPKMSRDRFQDDDNSSSPPTQHPTESKPDENWLFALYNR